MFSSNWPSSVASQRTAWRSAPFGVSATVGSFAVDFAWPAVDHVELRALMPNAGANLPGDERILLRHVVADEQRGIRRCRHRPSSRANLRRAGRALRQGPRNRRCGDGRDCSCPAWRARNGSEDNFLRWWCDSNRSRRSLPRRACIARLLQAPRDFFQRIFPACRLELAVAANERLADAFGIVVKSYPKRPLPQRNSPLIPE